MTITDCKVLLIWNPSRHSAPTHPQHLHNKSDVTGDFLTSDRDLLSPVMDNMKSLEYVLRAQVWVTLSVWIWREGSKQSHSQNTLVFVMLNQRSARLEEFIATFKSDISIYEQSSLDYIWPHLLYRKEDSPCESFFFFFGNIWCKTHRLTGCCHLSALQRSCLTVFTVSGKKDKGGKQSFSPAWPLRCLLICLLNRVLRLRQALWGSLRPDPPPLAFLFTLVFIPSVLELLSNGSSVRLLTDIWRINA